MADHSTDDPKAKRRRTDHHAPSDASSSTSVPAPSGYEYEVFLSFRGSDTRTTFTDYLYQDLVSAGIRAFRDDEELRKGEEIGPELLKAIKQSKIYIPVLSRGYAWSKWCLKEAVQMVECMETSNQMILPVFYDVTPHQVRHQTGDYDQAFCAHNENQPSETVTEWRRALSVLGQLKGWDLTDPSNRYQGKLVKDIVSEVWKQLNKSRLCMPDHLVGVDDHVDEIMDMLDIEEQDVRITVGIWGMSGVGKTTVAKFVYNQLMDHFQYCCFLSDIREKSSQPNGTESLQRQVVSEILRREHEEFADVNRGKGILKDRLRDKKVLILLDDVDRIEQLSNLLPDRESIAPGSRIIITTMNKTILDEFQVKRIYEVTNMNPDDALVLFCKHAFRQNFPIDEFADLSRKIAKETGGLPLAIEVIGSHLSSRLLMDVWREALDQLKKEPGIQNRLRISFDALDHDQREIFKDIACLFAGTDHRVLLHMWRACGFSPASATQDLRLKCLIKIGEAKEVWMHDQLKVLGREIVRRENYDEPGGRSRLWCHNDAIDVLEYEEGTSKVKAIHLDHGLEEVGKCFQGRQFENLKMLLVLNLGDANLDGNFEGRLLRLKWLSWHGSTLLNMPSTLHLKDLVVLDLSNSTVRMDWIGWSSIQVLKKLEVVNLTSCHHLTGTPDFSSFPPIKRLILEDCRALAVVHQSIGHLTTLESLSLKNCCSLERLPEELGNLSSLTELIVDGTLIQELPVSAGMSSLKILSARWCRSLAQVPESIGSLKKLQQLLLNHCQSLREIPSSVGELQSLEELNLLHTSVRLLPDSLENLTNLKVLDISHSLLRNFPCSLWNLHKLEIVNASYTQCLDRTIPFDSKSPTFLRILRLDNTSVARIPSSIQELAHLQSLDLKSCMHLRTLPELPSSLVNLNVTCQSPQTALLSLSNSVRLKQLDISGCNQVTKIPDNIGVLSRLKELSIGDCPGLQCLPQLPSGLRRLKLSGLPSLERLPELSNLKSLRKFSLLKCPRVEEIPGLGGLVSLKTLRISSPLTNLNGLEHLSSLSYLWVDGCKFKSLPDLSELKEILEITVKDCRDLIEIQGHGSLDTLTSLSIIGCTLLTALQGNQQTGSILYLPTLRNLESLKLDGLKFITEIHGIGNLSSLEMLPDVPMLHKLGQLMLSSCLRLREIPALAGITSLEILHIEESPEIEVLPNLSSLNELKQLKLHHCHRLREIPQLAGLASLEILEINQCSEIETLPDLSSLNELKQLVLKHCNQLGEIPPLAGLASLEILDIYECRKIEMLPDLSSQTELKQLVLSCCNLIRELPGLTGLTSLEKIHICECREIEIPQDLSLLNELKQLKLSHLHRYRQIPELAGLAALEVLEICSCSAIEMIPDLSSLKKLKHLVLGSCSRLRDIPALTGLVSLEVLEIRECDKIEKLPDLSSLNELKQLKLSCPQLRQLPQLVGLASLEILQIHWCKAVEMLPDLSSLNKLKQMELRYWNHLRGIPALTGLTSLEKLYLFGCSEIEMLHDLSSLYNLKELYAGCCKKLLKIQGLGDLELLEILDVSGCSAMNELEDMSNLRKLRELRLCDCPNVVKVPGLVRLASLEVLDISRSEMQELPDLSELRKLRELYLTGCNRLAGIQGLQELVALEVLDLSKCEALEEIPDLSMLHRLVDVILPETVKFPAAQGPA